MPESHQLNRGLKYADEVHRGSVPLQVCGPSEFFIQFIPVHIDKSLARREQAYRSC
jgi:hypothetical protein